MKQCKKCQLILDESRFYLKNKERGTLRTECKDCTSKKVKEIYENNKERHYAYTKNRRLQARLYVNDYLRKNPCSDCSIEDIRTLDFDHVRGKKYKNISLLINSGASLEVIQKEIDKCDVRCANCHRIKTAVAQNWNKF